MESENLVCNATDGTKTALGITQRWFIYSMPSFFKALGIDFSREAEKQARTYRKAFGGGASQIASCPEKIVLNI